MLPKTSFLFVPTGHIIHTQDGGHTGSISLSISPQSIGAIACRKWGMAKIVHYSNNLFLLSWTWGRRRFIIYFKKYSWFYLSAMGTALEWFILELWQKGRSFLFLKRFYGSVRTSSLEPGFARGDFVFLWYQKAKILCTWSVNQSFLDRIVWIIIFLAAKGDGRLSCIT